jgi:ankyrin repeat protein
MRRLILALMCGALVALPALAQPQAEPNPLESIGNAVRGFFNRIFGSEESKPQEASPAEAAPAESPKPQPEAPPPAPTTAFKGSPVARTVDRGLHDAIARGDYESALKMIDRGADIEAKDPGAGASALHFAVMKGNQPLIDLLVSRGADLNSRTRNGTTPLHTAVLYARLEVAEFLVGKGADVNAQSASGATPLALAIAAKNEPIAARLRELGAR